MGQATEQNSTTSSSAMVLLGFQSCMRRQALEIDTEALKPLWLVTPICGRHNQASDSLGNESCIDGIDRCDDKKWNPQMKRPNFPI
jgi:hypothetical protein